MTAAKLTPQEQKVYDFIEANRGCTTRDIINQTYVTCPSGRITEIRHKLEGSGRNIVSIGQKKFAGSRPFEMYAIESEQITMEEWFEDPTPTKTTSTHH